MSFHIILWTYSEKISLLCAVTVMDKHAATLMHYSSVKIQKMIHRE